MAMKVATMQGLRFIRSKEETHKSHDCPHKESQISASATQDVNVSGAPTDRIALSVGNSRCDKILISSDGWTLAPRPGTQASLQSH